MARLPPLNAVRVFAVAAERRSFKAAAEALHVTPGAVSRQIQALEAFLGASLFSRGYREVALTEAGQAYWARVAPALEAIDQATRRALDASRRAVVRVETTPAFAMYWLIPRLRDFRARFLDVDVIVTTAQGVLERRRNVDVFVRRDPAHFGGLAGEAFMTEWSLLVASPTLPGLKAMRSAGKVAGAPLIRMRSRPDLWPGWFARQRLAAPPAARFIEFDNTILAIQAAAEGLGVALVPRLFVDAQLDNGTLVCPPNARPFASGAYHLLRGRGAASAASRDFVAWLTRAAGAESQ